VALRKYFQANSDPKSFTLGPIVYLNFAGKDVVVLNSHKAVVDLLDRRAAIYSDRPRNIVASEILTRSLLVVFRRYDDL